MALTLLNQLTRRYGPALARRIYAQMWRPGMAQLAPLSAGAVARHQRLRQMTGGGGRVPPHPATRPKGLDDLAKRRWKQNIDRRQENTKAGSEADVKATAKWRHQRRRDNLVASHNRWQKNQTDLLRETVAKNDDRVDAYKHTTNLSHENLAGDLPENLQPILPGIELKEGKTDADRKAANERLRRIQLTKKRQLASAEERKKDKVIPTSIDLSGSGDDIPWGVAPAAEKVHIRVPEGSKYKAGYADKIALRELRKAEADKRKWAIARERARRRAERLWRRGLRPHPFKGKTIA